MFAGIFFVLRFKGGHENHKINPSQTLINLQYLLFSILLPKMLAVIAAKPCYFLKIYIPVWLMLHKNLYCCLLLVLLTFNVLSR